MSNIKALRPTDESLETMVVKALEENEGVKYCIIVTFSEDNKMDIYFHASASELAIAGAELSVTSVELSRSIY